MEANNMKAMREALELFAHMNDDGYYNRSAQICNIVAKAQQALAAPPRNCDLPNPEERYSEFCSRYLSCSSCPHNRKMRNELRCDGKWLLASAEEGGAE